MEFMEFAAATEEKTADKTPHQKVHNGFCRGGGHGFLLCLVQGLGRLGKTRHETGKKNMAGWSVLCGFLKMIYLLKMGTCVLLFCGMLEKNVNMESCK